MNLWGTDIELRLTNFQKIAEKEGVKLETGELSSPEVAGCYLWVPGATPRIVLSRWLRFEPVRHRCVFFEELGHHFTATEQDRRQPFIRYCLEGREIENQPLEKQALSWASRRLISDFEIRWFIKDGGGTLADFADRFKVTEELARERLNVLQSSNFTLWEYLIHFMADYREPAERATQPNESLISNARSFAEHEKYPHQYRIF